MSATKPSILISHSNKQYVHRVIEALLKNNTKVVFCTPLWWQNTPSWLKLLPSFLQKKIAGQIRKKSFAFSKPVSTIMRPSIILKKEMADAFTGSDKNLNQLNLEINHDQFAADTLKKQSPDIVIGYEISSLETFTVARQKKITTILDLAQVHYKCIDQIAHDYPDMSYILNDTTLGLVRERKRREYELADYILTLSSFASKTLADEGIDQDKIFTVNLGFDVQLFKPKQRYSRSGPLRLMICGTDMKRKGLKLLLLVIERLQQKGLLIQLTVVGPIGEISEIVKEFPEVLSVTCIPFLVHEELVTQYQLADLFVFPSYLDSWAMTVMEAMACGTPVIVSESTGSKDAVKKGGGLIIPAGDVEALEKSIVYFYDNRDALIAAGRKAVEVAGGYTWQNYYNEMGSVLKAIQLKQSL